MRRSRPGIFFPTCVTTGSIFWTSLLPSREDHCECDLGEKWMEAEGRLRDEGPARDSSLESLLWRTGESCLGDVPGLEPSWCPCGYRFYGCRCARESGYPIGHSFSNGRDNGLLF